MQKKYDIVATVGSYTKNGETKNRYKNVGVVMEKDGNPFILLDRTFNPAGLQSDKDTVLLSLYPPKEEKGGVSAHSKAKGNAFLDDEIPY